MFKYIIGLLLVSATVNAQSIKASDLKITPKTTVSRPTGTEGQLFTDSTTHRIQYKDNSSWYNLIGSATTDTLTNKTLSGNTAATLISGSGTLTLNTSGTITIPNSTDTLVGKATTDTLTNKTLTAPVISAISNTGTLTLPTSTDTLVGRATTDTLTNKTLTSPAVNGANLNFGTATNANRLLLATDTTTNLDALTDTAGLLAYDSTQSKPVYNDGASWKVIGTGSGAGSVNYITPTDAETNATTGIATYSDAAATSPSNGVGGSPTVTVTTSSSNPLAGTYSYLFTKDAANRQGQGFSIDFTIGTAWAGKVLKCQFEYAVASGTYADDDMSFWIYDTDNFSLIQGAPYLLKKHSTNGEVFFTEFQTASSSVHYRLIGHVASTSASAYDIKFDQINCSPGGKVYGSPVTDWVATPAPSGSISNGTRDDYKWRRVGDEVQVVGGWTFTGAGSLTGIVQANLLPSGLTVDESKLPAALAGGNDDLVPVGTYEATDASVAFYTGIVVWNKTSDVFGAIAATTGSAYFTPGSGDSLTINIRVPITGWGSSTIMSNDADNRVVTAQITGNPASATSGNPIIVPTVVFDTHGVYNASTGRYACSVTGYYKMYGSGVSASGGGIALAIYKNASVQNEVGYTDSNSEITYTGLVQCNAGDIIDLRPSSTYDASAFVLNIEKLSGSSQISAVDSVSARIYKAANQTSVNPNNSFVKINLDTADHDSHGAWASNKYTVPSSGRYQINAAVGFAGTNVLNSMYQVVIYKNGSLYTGGSAMYPSATGPFMVNISDVLRLLAGDYLEVYIYGSGNNSASTLTVVGGTGAQTSSYFSISRTGNY